MSTKLNIYAAIAIVCLILSLFTLDFIRKTTLKVSGTVADVSKSEGVTIKRYTWRELGYEKVCIDDWVYYKTINVSNSRPMYKATHGSGYQDYCGD